MAGRAGTWVACILGYDGAVVPPGRAAIYAGVHRVENMTGKARGKPWRGAQHARALVLLPRILLHAADYTTFDTR